MNDAQTINLWGAAAKPHSGSAVRPAHAPSPHGRLATLAGRGTPRSAHEEVGI